MKGVTYDFDLTSGQLKWGPGLEEVFGYPAAESTKTLDWWTGHIHPDDAMILNQAMDKLLGPTENSWVVIYRFRLADGSYVAIQDKASIIRDHSGQAIQLTGTLEPIRE